MRFSRMILMMCWWFGCSLPAIAGPPVTLADPSGNTRDSLSPARPPPDINSTIADPGQLVSVLKRRLPPADNTLEMQQAPEWFQSMMQRIAFENLPDRYVHDKDWGKTDRRWNGLDIRHRGGLRVYTKRKWKSVNHGMWKRYELRPDDPLHNFRLRIENVRESENGKLAFEVLVESKLFVSGRIAKWTKGVKIYSVSADAAADVALRIRCELGMTMDVTQFPPDVVFRPVVTDADLDVTDFRLQRISRFDGPVVKQLSRGARKIVLEKIEKKRDRLPEKINRQIAKHEDKMRLSLADLAEDKWQGWLRERAEPVIPVLGLNQPR